MKNFWFLILIFINQLAVAQKPALESFLNDPVLASASVSLYVINSSDNQTVIDYNSTKSLVPASIQKLITSAAALDILGADYTFSTRIGYTGSIDRNTGTLTGDIIIIGGGDPVLGSSYFREHYNDFLKKIVISLKEERIKKVQGKVITDDSRYDYQPVPPGWVWEDIGNYYGAGVYGLSIFDNTAEIHFKTGSEGSQPVITGIVHKSGLPNLLNMLSASGDSDNGYVFSAPYNNYGWMDGTIPVNRSDFILKASINDPPLLMSKIITALLDSAGIGIEGDPSTARLAKLVVKEDDFHQITEIRSPFLKELIKVLNNESVNLIAEHLIKELGKVRKNRGSTAAGIEVLYEYLAEAGIDRSGEFLEDGSGLSQGNAITTGAMTELLVSMQQRSKNYRDFFNSLPEAGKSGTLKSYFRDPVFYSNLRAKSGSMTRVRNYAGYFKTSKGNEMTFCIIVNNFSGSHQRIIKGIEDILREIIIND